jgi:hypothetical protein
MVELLRRLHERPLTVAAVDAPVRHQTVQELRDLASRTEGGA